MALLRGNHQLYVDLARRILVEVASGKRRDRLITYGQLLAEMEGHPGRGFIAGVLDEISCTEHHQHRPLLSAIVVHAKKDGFGEPGDGFWRMAVVQESVRKGSSSEKTAFWEQECERVWKYWQRPNKWNPSETKRRKH